MPDTLYPESLGERALEAGGREHIQVAGFEVMGAWCWFLAFHHWDVQLGRLEGSGVFSCSGGLRADQIYGRRLLGPSVGLGGKASCKNTPEQRISKSGGSSQHAVKRPPHCSLRRRRLTRVELLEGPRSKEAPFICRGSVFIPTSRIHGAKVRAR